MARCPECAQIETACTCSSSSCLADHIRTGPDGARYLDGEVAAGLVLLGLVGVGAFFMGLGWLTH